MHSIKCLIPLQGKQSHPRASQRGNQSAPFFEMGEEVFPQAYQQLVVAGPKIKASTHCLVGFDTCRQLCGNTILSQVAEVIPECLAKIGSPLSEGTAPSPASTPWRFFPATPRHILASLVRGLGQRSPQPPAEATAQEHVAGAGGAVEQQLDFGYHRNFATNYELLYGNLASLPSYTPLGSVCGLGTSGSASWSGVPAGNLWFLVTGVDGAGTEATWGPATAGERNGGSASGQCGNASRNNGASCP